MTSVQIANTSVLFHGYTHLVGDAMVIAPGSKGIERSGLALAGVIVLCSLASLHAGV